MTIIGKPNAGKSTLMNFLLGQKLSIVTHKAQTTRNRVLGILSEESYQIIMLDTPGVIEVLRTDNIFTANKYEIGCKSGRSFLQKLFSC